MQREEEARQKELDRRRNVQVDKEIDLEKEAIEKKRVHFEEMGNIISMLEYLFFIFVHNCKNRLLLPDVKKKEYFEKIQNNQGILRMSDMLDFLYLKAEEEFMKGGMIFFDPKDSVVEKAKNIQYVFKILETVFEKNKENKEVTEREIKFVEFGLQAI